MPTTRKPAWITPTQPQSEAGSQTTVQPQPQPQPQPQRPQTQRLQPQQSQPQRSQLQRSQLQQSQPQPQRSQLQRLQSRQHQPQRPQPRRSEPQQPQSLPQSQRPQAQPQPRSQPRPPPRSQSRPESQLQSQSQPRCLQNQYQVQARPMLLTQASYAATGANRNTQTTSRSPISNANLRRQRPTSPHDQAMVACRVYMSPSPSPPLVASRQLQQSPVVDQHQENPATLRHRSRYSRRNRRRPGRTEDDAAIADFLYDDAA